MPAHQSAPRPARLGILLSGRGSNFLAIADSIRSGRLPGVEIAIVISNVADAPASPQPATSAFPPPLSSPKAALAKPTTPTWSHASATCRRPRLPRRLHATALRPPSSPPSQIASSTSTHRSCPPSPASTPSSRPSTTASKSPAAPCTSSTNTSTTASSSSSAPSRSRLRRPPLPCPAHLAGRAHRLHRAICTRRQRQHETAAAATPPIGPSLGCCAWASMKNHCHPEQVWRVLATNAVEDLRLFSTINQL